MSVAADPKGPTEVFRRFLAQDRDNTATFRLQWALHAYPMAAVYGWRRLVFRAVQFGLSEDEAVMVGVKPAALHLARLNALAKPSNRLKLSDLTAMFRIAAAHALVMREGGGYR